MTQEELDSFVAERAETMKAKFSEEVQRLLNSGAVDKKAPGGIPWGPIFRVALENMATRQYSGSGPEVKNLRHF